MKRNALVRIIFFSLLILVLLSVLLIGLGVELFTFQADYDTEHSSLGSGTVPAESVRNIAIEWAAGRITIQEADTDQIIFQESSGKNAEPMVYRQTGGQLTIQYQKSKVHLGFPSILGKDLTITVPMDWYCDELQIKAADANLTINNFSASEVSMDSASGDCQFTNCDIQKLDVDCASGEIVYSGTLQFLDCESASGDVTAMLLNVPKSIDLDSASADLDLTLPADAGFCVEIDSISGDFSTDFNISRHDDRIICGDGVCNINVDGVSGDVNIRKHEQSIHHVHDTNCYTQGSTCPDISTTESNHHTDDHH